MFDDKGGWSIVTGHPAFAGLFGALVSLGFAPGARWRARAFNVFCGVAISWNLSSPLAAYFQLDIEKFSGAIGFMLGLAGMHIVHSLLTWLRDGGLPTFLKRKE
jgi:hypothetical protein